jgi:hypothetical protein
MKLYRTALAVMFLTVGCGTPHVASRPETAAQKEATGWGYFLPAVSQTIFMGTTAGPNECEGLRQRTIASSTPLMPSPCVPMRVTTE